MPINNALRVTAILTMITPLGAESGSAQQLASLPHCPVEQAKAFDFLLGHFKGMVFDLSGGDSVSTGVQAEVTAEKVSSGCALLERWHFTERDSVEDDVVVLRGYDMASRTWSYDLVNLLVSHLTWVGENVNGEWYFHYLFANGDHPAEARIRWVPVGKGYSEQVSRSTDGGKTWINTRHINFQRALP